MHTVQQIMCPHANSHGECMMVDALSLLLLLLLLLSYSWHSTIHHYDT